MLLAIDLLFLPWFSVSAGHASVSATATGDPDGLLGIVAVLSIAALIADVTIERLRPRPTRPARGGRRTGARYALAAVTAYSVTVKFLLHIGHFGDLDLGFWAALILTPGLLYFARQASNKGTLTPRPPQRRIR